MTITPDRLAELDTIEPGDVVALGDSDLRGFVTERNGRVRVVWPDHSDNEVEDVAARPLVVIDPEDREQVERLIGVLSTGQPLIGLDPANRDLVDAAWLRHTQAALRSLIAPPKPEEPTGLGAVVEDERGMRWVRITVNGAADCWKPNAGRLTRSPWAEVPAVRVLSEGVTNG